MSGTIKMSAPILLKIYGHIYPAQFKLFTCLKEIAIAAIPEPEEPAVTIKGDLLSIAFAGIYFPVEETIEAIETQLTGCEQGKIDILDLEAWRLTRYLIKDGNMSKHAAPLNNVLDWSGH